jgi:mannose-6-phosphate isomerase-like protein (cupin superfamily)
MTEDYRIHLDPLFGTMERMDLRGVAERADHPWYNQTVVQVGDVLVRLGVFAGGEFHWHRHDEQDEFFLVLEGALRIDLEDHEPVELDALQAFSVPAGRLHRPVATGPTTVLMIEKAGVLPTGDR